MSLPKRNKELYEKYCEEMNIKPELYIKDISDTINKNCENTIGFHTIPLGISHRKLKVNNNEFYIPVATTEGGLVASMCRGIKLLNMCQLEGFVENLGTTRSFSVEFETFKKTFEVYKSLKNLKNQKKMKEVSEKNSKYLKVRNFDFKMIGNCIFIKMWAYTGNAMGMNMITKACTQLAKFIENEYGGKLLTISANTCVDKKSSPENFINGRGRSVMLKVNIPNDCLRKILKVDAKDIYTVYKNKIVLGSGLVMGMQNCQVANYVAGIFLALGQDLGQIIESSNALLYMDLNDGLDVTFYMPSIMVGSVGGGTSLSPQKEFLKQFEQPQDDYVVTDRNLDQSTAPNYIALVIAGAALAGELSLLASLSDNTLMVAHEKLNRGNMIK